MKIGILAIGMVVLFIASTIPAVTAVNTDPKIGISQDVLNPNIILIDFVRFVEGTDKYTITATRGESGSNIVYQVEDVPIVYEGLGESETDHVEFTLDGPGLYSIEASCGGIVQELTIKLE